MRKPFYRILYVQVLVAVVIGAPLGHYSPEPAVKMKLLGDDFIQLIKMMVSPIIFCTVVSGIASVCDMKKVGRTGGKALLCFEVVLTFVLIIGLTVGHIFNPSAGFNTDINTIDAEAVTQHATKAHSADTADFLFNIIPSTAVDAFAKDDILQTLLIAPLFGGAFSAIGERVQMVTDFIDQISHVFLHIVYTIMRVASIGAFGAMAFTIGKHGMISLVPLLKLVGMLYFMAIIFVVVVLGITARVIGFSIFHFVAYIKEELLIVLGTSSLGSALPHLMEKMEKLGCSESVMGPVVPTGYPFNLDGTNIYMTMTVIFISRVLNIELTWTQQLTILAVAMLISRGASGTTGAGFITLAATLAAVPGIPVTDMVLVLGIDRFMSECHALTNITGNNVARMVISAWERELDRARLARVLPGDHNNEGMSATPAA